MSAKTVLFLDHTAKWSGGEIALLRTLQEMEKTRIRPVVALGEDGPFAQHLRKSNIEVRIVPLSEASREVRKGSLTLGSIAGKAGVAADYVRYVGKIAALARDVNAGVIHCNSLKADLYGGFAGNRAKIPVVWHIRDTIDASYLPGPVVRVFQNRAAVMPAYVVCNSQHTLDTLFPPNNPKWAKRRETCAVIHDGLTNKDLSVAARPEITGKWKNTPPCVGIVGRLVEWKGQHVFLEAAKKVLDSGVSAEFVLIGAPLFGEADYETRLKKQAEPLGNAASFTGFRADVSELMKTLDILVHASITPEPFGQVVTEGLASGLPVIGTDAGGVREILTSGKNGILTPPGDADALSDALCLLLNDPAKAQTLAQAGWAHIRAQFTARQTANRLEAVYDTLWK